MTTGYTQAELDNLHRIMADNPPPSPTLDDLKTSPSVSALAWNGSHTGILMQVQFQAQQGMVLHLNCVVARDLMLAINEAAIKYGWWNAVSPGAAEDDTLPIYSTDHDDRAMVVYTLATGATKDGVLIAFGDGQDDNLRVFFPRSVARGIVVSIVGVADAAGWWDKDFVLQPAVMPDNTVIYRAANQLMKQHGKRAAIEAALRSSAAMEAGDMFNHDLWQGVCNAVLEMERTASKPGDMIN